MSTSESNYLEITVDASHRHAGAWDDSKYHLVVSRTTQAGSAIYLNTNYFRLDGLQVSLSSQGDAAELLYLTASGQGRVSNCIVVGYSTSYMTRLMSIIDGIEAWNCVFISRSTNGGADAILNHGDSTYTNCTIIGNSNGNGLHVLDGSVTAINCYVRADANYTYYGTFAALTTCASSDGYQSTTTIAYDTSTGSGHGGFTNVTAGSENLQIKDGSALQNIGTDRTTAITALQGDSNDIAGHARPTGSSTWDIGAFEYSGGGSSAVPVIINQYRQRSN